MHSLDRCFHTNRTEWIAQTSHNTVLMGSIPRGIFLIRIHIHSIGPNPVSPAIGLRIAVLGFVWRFSCGSEPIFIGQSRKRMSEFVHHYLVSTRMSREVRVQSCTPR